MHWPLTAFLVLAILVPTVSFWVALLIRNRKREPGEQTLFDYRMKQAIKT